MEDVTHKLQQDQDRQYKVYITHAYFLYYFLTPRSKNCHNNTTYCLQYMNRVQNNKQKMSTFLSGILRQNIPID